MISLGRWFESGSKESFTFAIIERAYATNSRTFYSFFVCIYILNCFFYVSGNLTSCPILEKKLLSNLENPFKFMGLAHEIMSSLLNTLFCMRSFDSSVGRAEDCRSIVDILRSLVRIRLEGIFYFRHSRARLCSNSTPFYSIFVYITLLNWLFDVSGNLTSCPILEKKLLSNLENPFKFMGLAREIMYSLSTLCFVSVPSIAQLVERRTVEV